MTISTMKKTFFERHETWNRLVTARGHIGWSRHYVSPFMSAWCIHQQYCHVNQVSGAELLEPFDMQDVSSRMKNPRLTKSFLATDTWMPQMSALGQAEGSAFGELLKAIHGASLKCRVGAWLRQVADDSQIRLCSMCREKGYQSIFDQVLGLDRCPIHGERYLTECLHCGSALPSYSFERTRDGLACGQCKAYLMPFSDRALVNISASDRADQERAWAPFAAWCRRVSQLTSNSSIPGFPYRTEETESVPPPVRFLWVLDAIEPLPKEIHKCVTPRITSLRHVRISMRAHGAEDSASHHLPLDDEAARERRAVYKSIARHLRRRYLVGHGECLLRMERDFFVMNFGDGKFASRLVDGCHVAQAYLYWCYSLCRNHAPRGHRPILEMFLPSAMGSDIRVWAHQILSAFCERFAAMRIAYRMEADASSKCLFAGQEGVRDVIERLELSDAQLRLGSIVIETPSADVVVVGRGPLPDLIAPSCSTCCTPKALRSAVRPLSPRTSVDTGS